ncbi:dynamin family protein [Gilvimarinus sp. F26214L]|uniref:dynamin family protein n=1 Tax=Gilvimarinus sp. DZF01 TaxID=3461371 RepID=UPI00404684EF
MDVRSLYRQMASFDQWKTELQTQLRAFQSWFRKHRIKSTEAETLLRHALSLLSDKRFTIACVGEFSRGKTELINALLYSEYGQRLLPSKPGRTTMCPTEIYYEPDSERCCVRLLPIETRRGSSSVDSFRRIPGRWVHFYFDPRNPAQVAEAVSQISATKAVSEREAREMGFDSRLLTRHPDSRELVEIPAWRHALINLDHALLRQGLRIVDTPGLNALGNEPELTLNTLPGADAVIFLLAADAGVSASDMAIWNDHIEVLRQNRGTAVLVLLNKIDTLWHDLSSPEDVARSIREVRETTARQLQLPIEHVVPISAKEGLLAKAAKDKPRLLRSSLLKMEMLLAERIVENQQSIVSHRAIRDALTIAGTTYRLLRERSRECRREVAALTAGTSTEAKLEALEDLRRNIKDAHTSYHRQALSLRSSQRLLDRQRIALIAPMSSLLLDQVIASTTERLNRSWTTVGLARGISEFFEVLESNLNNMVREAERANKVLAAIYARPEHAEAGNDLLERHLFSVAPYQRQLSQLKHQSIQFRRSLDTLLASKSRIIERFVQSLVREVRNLYSEVENDIGLWAEEALAPLVHHNLYQKQLLERHMMRLTTLNTENRDLDAQLQDLRSNAALQEQALSQLGAILERIRKCAPGRPDAPHNVVSLDARRAAAAIA